MNNLNELSKQIYEGNKLRGFDVSKENIGQTLMLIVSELAEALEAHRKNRFARLNNWEKGYSRQENLEQKRAGFELHIKDTFEDEIADTFIRLFDLTGALEIDIEKHIDLKLRYNSTREYKHGKAY
jgi:NTP pyrophosphatase (non-canonical NTP hydrolase)